MERLNGDADLRVRRLGPSAGIGLSGEIDLSTVDLLRGSLAREVARGGRVVLDLREVTFMDSTGLKAIVQASRQLEGRGTLEILPSPVVRKLFDLTGMGQAPTIMVVPDAVEDPDHEVDPTLARRLQDPVFEGAYRSWLASVTRGVRNRGRRGPTGADHSLN